LAQTLQLYPELMKNLLFTDIDGTLIDHHTYSYAFAKKALKKLALNSVPVIFCSSKTFSEQVYLQKKLDINYPFIFENGSAVAIPKEFFPSITANRVNISESHDMVVLTKKNSNDIGIALKKINTLFNLNCYGYSKSNDKEIAAKTGLHGKAVHRAKGRWFTESLFSERPTQEALQVLESFGLCALQGGRFFTVQGKDVDKGKAVEVVIQLFQDLWGEKTTTIGIGDSLNDAPFLKVVDLPFLVQKHDGCWAEVKANKLTKIRAIGPKGFSEMTSAILNL